jgi:hypothetical protein
MLAALLAMEAEQRIKEVFKPVVLVGAAARCEK